MVAHLVFGQTRIGQARAAPRASRMFLSRMGPLHLRPQNEVLPQHCMRLEQLAGGVGSARDARCATRGHAADGAARALAPSHRQELAS